MFYRRKILLALLQSFEGRLEKISLQKLLLLLTDKQNEPVYSFIPYHYGSYSISANADLTAMVKHGLIKEGENYFQKIDKKNYIEKLTIEDKNILAEIKERYGNLDSNSLIKHTYLTYPYYAINSKVAKNLLGNIQYQQILLARPVNDEISLFTIGYEGISFEEYLNRLIKNDIKTLVDVRNNAVSMKFGFSKKTLRLYCEKIGIDYVHIPEVGIRSEYRQELKEQSDYNDLFKSYKKDTLTKTKDYQQEILKLLETKRRIALTCFEADISKCHRTCLAEAIIKLSESKYKLKHI